jgi:hypothetical protein
MRFVPTRLHGVANYLAATILIFLAVYMGLSGPAFWGPVALAAVAAFYSLLTDYEFGLIKFLRIRFHLVLDAVFGFVVIAYAVTIGLSQTQQLPFVLIGILSIILAATTQIRAVGTTSLKIRGL